MNTNDVKRPEVNNDPNEPIIVSVSEYKRRGVFRAAIYSGPERCLLLARQADLSRSPLISAAQRLLAAGHSPSRRIIMVHDDRNEIALISTIGEAAQLVVKQSPTGSLTFGKYDENDKRRPRRRDNKPIREAHPAPAQNNASARLATSALGQSEALPSPQSKSKLPRAA